MMPIQDLLNQIRWDPAFGQGDFAISFYDRLEQSIIWLPLKVVWFEVDIQIERRSKPLDQHYRARLANRKRSGNGTLSTTRCSA